MDNPFKGKSKRDLMDIQLRLLNETANLRADSRSLRWRLESTRSALAAVSFQMEQLKEALTLETVISFPTPAIDVTPVPVVDKQRLKKTS
jgi:hypothetical protein